jgi:DNA primase catalytic subunit
MEQSDRIRIIARNYYARKDIQEILAQQAWKREFVPRYFEGFGKRPDTVEYAGDILNYVEKGATSFHVSEELWSNPLEIGTNLNQEQLNKIRVGWDLILDIDCKFIEFSKIAAFLLCEALFFHGVRNFGLKFSGGSGFHIGLAWEAFPEEINNQETKNLFPEGPRIIASYLKSMIESPLREHILKLSDPRDIALSIGKPEKFLFKGDFNPFSVLEIDTILIAPRHLYRAAYSLNEKTGLVSCVIKPENLKAFHPAWARPDRIFPQSFLKKPEKNEAKELLIQAFDWHARQETRKNREIEKVTEKIEKTRMMPRTELKITKLSDSILPPCIKKILEGMKHDGRKRALFILLGFFRNLGLEFEDIQTRVLEWNKKNYQPLRESYVRTQINWFKRQEKRLPPNCNLQAYYQDIGVCMPDALCRRIKNPVNYVAVKVRSLEGEKFRKKTRKKEN